MKLSMKSICALICFSALASPVLASHGACGKVYVGVFGGGGANQRFNANQYGTAFYLEAAGGPLAVNAFGDVDSESTWFAGAQLGYQAPDIMLDAATQWSLAPAAELEGYYMGGSSFGGSLSNNTARLPAHDFDVSFPMSRSVYLVNAVLKFDNPCILVHPYLGLGIGSALTNISGADSLQVAPPEFGVNHFNGHTGDMDTAFAGQVKIGLTYEFNDCVSVFAEYRWLYLSSTHYIFGSTIATGHVETSNWHVSLDAQRYNLGSAGIRFTW